MNYLLSLVLTLGLIPTGFSATENVFGSSHREMVSQPSYPLSLVGKLINPEGYSCTASLVGNDLALTAAHCIANEKGELLLGEYEFKLPGNLGTAGITKFWYGQLLHDSHNSSADWALVKLDTPLGVQNGYFGSTVINKLPSPMNSKLIIDGYGVDFYQGASLSYEQGCTIQSFDFDSNEAHHNCSASPGDSGAPIYRCDENNLCSIVAMHVAARQDGKAGALHLDHYVEENANIAVSAKVFDSAIKEARK